MRRYILLVLVFCGIGISLNAQNVLIADYPLTSDGNDATGNNEAMTLTNTVFENGGVYCNGIYPDGEAENAFEAITPPIKNFNFNSFTVSVDFFVTEVKTQPVIVCGMFCRWMGFYLNGDGTVGLLYNNAEHYDCDSTYTINQWHHLEISWDGMTADAYLDGVNVVGKSFDLDYAPCGNEDTSIGPVNNSNGEIFKGYLRNLKVFAKL